MSGEKNITIATKVANSVDLNLDNLSQNILIFLYKKFPYLGDSILNFTYGQILLAITLVFFVWILRPIFVSLIIKLMLILAKKTNTKYDDLVIKNFHKPLRFTFLILALYIFVSILYLRNDFINLILSSLLIFNFYWFVWAFIDGIEGILYKATSKLSKELSNELSHFVIRIIKILIWILGISSVLSIWGINVTALLASLGLGGLAFALAAKDTAANLFGSIALLLDKSIKIGDWIIVDGVEGIVEDIGMRTTKIRTFKKSLVVVPNQIVANSHIENFSRRDVRRIKISIGLIYDTTNEQIENIIRDIKSMLKNHPGIAQNETMLVNFDNFGDWAKEIFIYTFTNTSSWQEYLDIKEDIYYKISKIVEKNGSSFAFPSQSIYVEKVATPAHLKQN